MIAMFVWTMSDCVSAILLCIFAVLTLLWFILMYVSIFFEKLVHACRNCMQWVSKPFFRNKNLLFWCILAVLSAQQVQQLTNRKLSYYVPKTEMIRK